MRSSSGTPCFALVVPTGLPKNPSGNVSWSVRQLQTWVSLLFSPNIYIYIYWSASKWTENDQSRLNRIKIHRIGLNRPEWTKLDRKKKTKKTKWTELYEREPNGPKWTKLDWIDRSGRKRTELDIKGPKWTELDRSRPKRTEMDRIRQKRTEMDHNGPN